MNKLNSFAIVLTLVILCTIITPINAQEKQTLQTTKKYAHFIITDPAPPPPPGEKPATEPSNLGEQPKDMLLNMTYLDDKILKGAYYTEVSWLLKAYPDKVWVTEHVHDFDEVFGFYGSDPENPKKLNGAIEMIIDGESHIITQSCLVFVPKGVKHCPLTIKRIDKPILMFTSGPSAKYAF